jgi:hypothetical protein
MAEAPPDAKCDIRMSFDEWRRTNDKPLFFLAPDRIQKVVGEGLTVERIYREAGSKTRAPLGRDAIRRALEFHPSFLSKILDIKNVINSLSSDSFEDELVIAAVFAMPELNADMKFAAISDEEMAKVTKYPKEAVIAARENYRIPLDFGMKLVGHLNKKGLSDRSLDRCLTITGGDRKFVKNLGSKEKPEYVFGSDDLIGAPPMGHPWARSTLEDI